MNSNSLQSYETAKELIINSEELFEQQFYMQAHYYAGLAVEFLLRAYLYEINIDFYSKHDLQQLAKDSKFYDYISPSEQVKYSNIFSELNLRWRSYHRFYSEARMRKYLKQFPYYKSSKGKRVTGDFIKSNARSVMVLALQTIHLGGIEWKNKSKKY